MKVLSLTQPWATLVALQLKRIETRSWSTSYRGELFIHASKGFPKACRQLCAEWPFEDVLNAAGVKTLPVGAILACSTLADVITTERAESTSAIDAAMSVYTNWQRWQWSLTVHERAFGDYGVGRYAWLLGDVRALATPVSASGALGLWTPTDPRIEPAVREQLRAA